MSMSAKIYSIVFGLLFLAVIILGIGLYSVSYLGGEARELGDTSGRAVGLNLMDRQLLERQLTVNTILRVATEKEKQDLIDTRLKATETEMNRLLVRYREYFPDDSPAEMLERPVEIRKRWNAFVEASNEAVQMSLFNSNVKADQIARDLIPFWGSIFQEVDALAETIAASGVDNAIDVALDAQSLFGKLALYRLESLKFNMNTNEAAVKTIEKSMLGLKDDLLASLKRIASQVPAGQGGNAAQAMENKIRDAMEPVLAQIIPIMTVNSTGKAAALYETKVVPAMNYLDEYTTNLINNATAEMVSDIAAVNRRSSQLTYTMLVICLIGIGVALVLSFGVIRGITRRLGGIIDTLGNAASEVSSAANQISDSAQSLAEGSTEQAASLEETSSALEEMASMTRQNADNANKTNDTTRSNTALVTEGATSVTNMSAAMGEISESAEQINRIIKTIEDIAFQTNLLALNAAVEAARAGEAGKGFAVVADEVRNLANRSAQAARDTTTLIQTTIDRVRHGSAIADELDTSFKDIEEGSLSVAHLISEITVATNEQAQGVDQVNTAVAQMDKVTQNNAASAEESASAAEELSAQAKQLDSMVEDLIALVEGGKGTGTMKRFRKKKPGKAIKVKAGYPQPQLTGNHSLGRDARKTSDGGGMKMLSASEVIPLGEADDF